jgi:hypothetical protein
MAQRMLLIMRPDLDISFQRKLKFSCACGLAGFAWLLISHLFDINESFTASPDVLLTQEPLQGEVLTQVAEAAEALGDKNRARQFYNLAAARSLRDVKAQSHVIDDLVVQKQYSKALEHVDYILRAQTEGHDRVFQLISAIATLQDGYGPVLATLAQSPKWQREYLNYLARDHKNFGMAYKIYSELRADGNELATEESKYFLDSLVSNSQIEQAHFVWLDSLTRSQLQKVSLLYDGEFTETPHNQYFDWTVADLPDVKIGLAPRANRMADFVLALDFEQAKPNKILASQYLKLEAGRYIFQVDANGANLRGEASLEWQIRCEEKTAALASTVGVSIGARWKNYVVNFEVPTSDCSYQKLVLRPRNSVAGILDGQLYFDNLKLIQVKSDDT